MKKPTIWRLALMNVIAAMTFGVVACGNEEDDPVAPPAVESSRELPDPTMDYSYKLNILGGTNSSQSPFAVLPNKTLSLEWAQSATYTYFSEKTFESNVVSCAPKATAKVYAKADTLWLSDVSEIKKFLNSQQILLLPELTPK